MDELFPTCVHGQDVGGCVLCHARRTDPATSHAAAAVLPAGHAGVILEALRAGRATQSELAGRVGLLPHQVNKRLADLKRRGLAEPTGRVRAGHAGRDEREWAAT